MCRCDLIVKIIKSAFVGYVVRRALKESDMFICNKESKEKQTFLCLPCGNVVPAKIYRVTIQNPYCPFCNAYIDHKVFEQLYPVEDTQNENKKDSTSNGESYNSGNYK